MSVQTVDKIGLGTWARVFGLLPGEETIIHFVPEDEAAPTEHRLSPDSYLGRALMNAQVGDRIPIRDLDNNVELEVLEIGLIRDYEDAVVEA